MGDTTTTWERSSFCASGSCVEVAKLDDDVIAIRDGKNPSQPPLLFTRADWSAFLDRVVGGEYARV